MTKDYSEIQNVARDYYNSDDAHTFYVTVWGGEDLHLGIYRSEDDTIFDASRRTVERMASHVGRLDKGLKVLDLGSGIGGTARYLAGTYGCHVTALNISETENEHNRKKNWEQSLDHLIEVVDGAFDDLPFEDDTFDVVWSQDAFLHSEDRARVMAQAQRVLKKGGDLIFTDPMQSDDCPEEVIAPILERIHLSSLGSPGFYLETGRKLGLELVEHEDLTPHLTQHYATVLKETLRREEELKKIISTDYLERMKKGLDLWVEGGKKRHLAWGIFHFRNG